MLVNGAAGGVGTFAVQIAKSMGAEVTGVCSAGNVELVRGLGADHVADKDDLLDGMVDLVVAEIEVPLASDPWKEAMIRRATSAHAVLLRHPWACGLLMSRANVGPAMLRYVDATIGCLHAAGFPLPLVDHAWNAMDSHIYGFTLHRLNFPFQAEEYAQVAAAYLPSLSRDRYPAMHALTVLVVKGEHDGIHDLRFGLDLLLDGLERLLPPQLPNKHCA